MTKIGEDITKKIEFVPATVQVKDYARVQYACKHCEGHIKRAALPPMILSKCVLPASILAYLIVSKFADHLPILRIERQFARLGVYLPRGLMYRSLPRVAIQLKVLVDILSEDIREGPLVETDDTIMPLQNDIPGRERTIQAHLWVYKGGPINKPPLVLLRFTRTRSHDDVKAFLKDYRGYLVADGVIGYKALFSGKLIKHVACMAHCRRKFVDVVKATHREHRAHDVIAIIKALYRIEDEVKCLPVEKQLSYRKTNAKPLLNDFKNWLVKHQSCVPPKTKLGITTQYATNLWPALNRYLEQLYLPIDNNAVERIVRSPVLGRRNFLFVGSQRGGEAAAIYYSLVESCKSYNINALAYFTDILQRLPQYQTHEDYAALAPDQWAPSSR